MLFLSPCNVEIVLVPGFQGLSCSKTVGWRVVCSKKLSIATFFFLGQLFGGQLFELFARETNLKKQSSVHLGFNLTEIRLSFSERRFKTIFLKTRLKIIKIFTNCLVQTIGFITYLEVSLNYIFVIIVNARNKGRHTYEKYRFFDTVAIR